MSSSLACLLSLCQAHFWIWGHRGARGPLLKFKGLLAQEDGQGTGDQLCGAE